MGKPTKATKKFQKKNLPKVLERRKAIKKIKQKHKLHNQKLAISSKNCEARITPLQGTTLESDDELDLAQCHKEELDSFEENDTENEQSENSIDSSQSSEDDQDFDDQCSSNSESIKHKSKTRNDSQELLSLELIEKWRSSLYNDHSIKTMKQVAAAFKAAVHSSETEKNTYKYQIDDPEVFNQLLILSLVQIPKSIIHHLPPSEKTGRVSTDSAKFKTLSPILKSHFSSILHLLPTLTDPVTIKLVLSESEKLVPYMFSYRKFLGNFLKTTLDLWSSSPHDSVRVSSFLVAMKLGSTGDSATRDSCMKLSYTALVKQFKHVTVHSLPRITFIKNSAVELFGIDQNSAYTVAFGYIRQLAIHLRTSTHNNTKESYKTVYNWQYINSVDFWSIVLSRHCERENKVGRESPLKQLIYPLVQITLGAMRLRPSPQCLPLQFHLIRSLLRISKAVGTYIPLTPYLFEVINCPEVRKKGKPSTQKPLDFEIIIFAPKAYLGGKIYQDGLIDQVIELFAEFYYLLSKSIAFPELVIPTIVQLKRYMKKCKNIKLNKSLVSLVEKLETHASFIEQERSKVEFSPEKTNEVERFLEGVIPEKLDLGKWVVVQRQIREEKRQLLREALQEDTPIPEMASEDEMYSSEE